MTNRALLIGTSKCPKDRKAFPKLPAVEKDLRGFENVLSIEIRPTTGIFEHIELLLNGTATEIAQRVEEFCSASTASDLVLIYYSGHGKLDEFNNLYLAAYDSRSALIRTSTFRIELLRGILEGCLSQKIVVVLDCCHSGAAISALSKDTEIEELRRITQGTGRYVLTSSGSHELSWVYNKQDDAGAGRSQFTHYLIDGIESGAADLNQDGFIDADELYSYVQHRASNSLRTQKPTISRFGAGGSLVLARSSKRKRPDRTKTEPRLIGPFVEKSEAPTRLGGNAYAYENCHIVSAWNLVAGVSKCRVALIAGKADRSHPALRDVDITEIDLHSDRKASDPDDFTTSIAALIGGERDQAGFVGVAPGIAFDIMDVFGGVPSTGDFHLLAAIDKAIERKANIIYCAFGFKDVSEIWGAVLETVFESGVCFVAPVGHSGTAEKVYPAAYPQSIAVCALDLHDRKTAFSDFGEWVTICAPGEDIWSCGAKGRHISVTGSSYAAAVITGVLGMMYELDPHLTPQDIHNILRATADPIDYVNPDYAGKLGAGRINAYRALSLVRSRLAPVSGYPPLGNRIANRSH